MSRRNFARKTSLWRIVMWPVLFASNLLAWIVRPSSTAAAFGVGVASVALVDVLFDVLRDRLIDRAVRRAFAEVGR